MHDWIDHHLYQLIDEATARGISVILEDRVFGILRMAHGSREITFVETMPETTPATAIFLCDEKYAANRYLSMLGYSVPEIVKLDAGAPDAKRFRAAGEYLQKHGSVVVKPARGEGGAGITVDIRSETALTRAIRTAEKISEDVLVEQYVKGRDYRILVIGGKFAAAIERIRPEVIGDGSTTIRQLIQNYNEALAEEVDGDAKVPFDDITRRTLRLQGYGYEDVPEKDVKVLLRKTANVTTGAHVRDVTNEVPEPIIEEVEHIAAELGMPLLGVDYLAEDIASSAHYIVELNARPGLVNHEPQPVCTLLLDCLFPETIQKQQQMAA